MVKREDFSISKIKNAISKAFNATGIQDEQQLVADITMNVISQFATPTITVEEIQDLVEKALMKVRPEVAKKYIIYREWRNTERGQENPDEARDGRYRRHRQERCQSEQRQHEQPHARRTKMTFASEVTKDYTYKIPVAETFLRKHTNWATSTSTTWITIRQRRRPASSMTWTTSLNADSYQERKYPHATEHSELRHAGNHHFPNQPERATRRTGNPRLRFLHGERSSEVIPQTLGFVHQLLRGDGKRKPGGRKRLSAR